LQVLLHTGRLLSGFLLLATLCCLGMAAMSSTTMAGEWSGPVAIDARRLTLRAAAYDVGTGTRRDHRVAHELYCEAARQGDTEAMQALAWLYVQGRGAERDPSIAAGLFHRAAVEGDRPAPARLMASARRSPRLPDCLTARMPVPPEMHGMPQAISPIYEGEIPRQYAWLPPEKRKVAQMVRDMAAESRLDPRLALAVVAVESNFERFAHSHADARGLMQMIPKTARRFNVRDPFDPRDNVRGGIAYLRWLLAYYRGDVLLATAAYNAGEEAVDRYRGVPPYAETQDYVRKVRVLYAEPVHPYDPTIVDPSEMRLPEGPRLLASR